MNGLHHAKRVTTSIVWITKVGANLNRISLQMTLDYVDNTLDNVAVRGIWYKPGLLYKKNRSFVFIDCHDHDLQHVTSLIYAT